MGAPIPGMKASGDATAEALLSAFKNIAPAEMRRHATVFNYWQSIRGDRQFPPIRDLDPLEISDAGPCSVLMEMVGGGEDGEIRHLGQSIKMGVTVEKLSEAPHPSLLSCILGKLPIVASSRQAFAFEDEFEHGGGTTRCWVTLLPFSATGTWIDYVYGFVSLHPPADGIEEAPQSEAEAVVEQEPEPQAEAFEETNAQAAEPVAEVEAETAEESVEEIAPAEPEYAPESEYEPEPEPEAKSSRSSQGSSGKPGFSAKLFESLASVGGFYGRVVEVDAQPDATPEPEPASVLDIADALIAEAAEAEEARAAEPEKEAVEPEAAEPEAAEPQTQPVAEVVEPEPAPEPEAPAAKEKSRKDVATEGTLQSKLTEVRAKADEARMAKLRANAALYDGLGAAYDFALDAEENAEEYLKLCEAQGLKIQLRSPMKPVVKLAFDGLCDESTIAQLEAVLAWALKSDLPRGSLAQRIEEAGGIGGVLNGNGQAKAA